MNPIKRMLGMAPTPDDTGRGYIPSPLGRLLGVAKKSDYEQADFAGRTYDGDKKILVLCTEERYFEMTNGTLFSTGQNALETAVPLMHLTASGFDFDVVTPTGAPAVIEEWSAPIKDQAVLGFLADHRGAFDRPLSLRDLVAQDALDDDSPYVALFLPGGHGAMVGLPEDPNVGALIRWIEATDRYLVAVCHGPAAMLAATVDHDGPHPTPGTTWLRSPTASTSDHRHLVTSLAICRGSSASNSRPRASGSSTTRLTEQHISTASCTPATARRPATNLARTWPKHSSQTWPMTHRVPP